jgi:putative membrane protein insertion efficiency factor
VSELGPGARALTGAIRAYQAARRGRPSPCRFEPSCSVYAHEAIVTHGAVRGSALALRRLSRCRPFGGRGWDPVPAAPPRKAA